MNPGPPPNNLQAVSVGPAWKGNPESNSPGSIEEAASEFAKLKAEGKIRNIGGLQLQRAAKARALNVAPITSLQPPYSLLATEVEVSTLRYAHFTTSAQSSIQRWPRVC
jgi:aryl-alcohol dehydrogenase-like predicted oxidoreductase